MKIVIIILLLQIIFNPIGNKWWIRGGELKKLEDLIKPMESRAKETLSGVKKAINLPAWDKLTFRVDPGETKAHFLTGHKAGELRLETSNRMGGKKTIFPKWMSEDQIIDAIKEAYQTSTKSKSTKFWEGERTITLDGYSDKYNLKIRIHINLDQKQIESAYPRIK